VVGADLADGAGGAEASRRCRGRGVTWSGRAPSGRWTLAAVAAAAAATTNVTLNARASRPSRGESGKPN
jgi:hypothetical protein